MSRSRAGGTNSVACHSDRFSASASRGNNSLGVTAFLILVAVTSIHLNLPLDPAARYLISANYYIEWAGTFGLIVAPPVAVALAVLHWLSGGKVFLSLVSVGVGSLLTLATVAAIVMSHLA